MKQRDQKIKVLMACGGTGGHVYPGIAIAKKFVQNFPQAIIVFVGTKRGIESRIVPDMGFHLVLINSISIKDKIGIKKILGLILLPLSFWRAFIVIRKQKPDLLVSIGGYAGAPFVFGSFLSGVKVVILEPNTIPGLSNRIMGFFAKKIFLGFSEAESFFSKQKVIITGNPVRDEIMKTKESKNQKNNIENIFCFGGSQGAVAINKALIAALPFIAQKDCKINFYHQAGNNDDLDKIRTEYKKYGFYAEVFGFTDSIWDFYKKADLVIARSGATTIAELSVLEIPSVLVPYPYAADNHQLANAKSLEKANGTVVIEQNGLTGEGLASEILKITPEKVVDMRSSLRAFARNDAALQIVKESAKLIEVN